MADTLVANDGKIESFRAFVRDGVSGMKYVPMAIKAVLSDGCWRERRIKTGEVITFSRFEDFVMAQPLEGLGADIALIRRIVSADVEALDLLDRTCQREPGGDRSKLDNCLLYTSPSPRD